MANWTEPKTMVQGAAALSSDWNTYIRDNTQHLKDEIARIEQNAFAISIALS